MLFASPTQATTLPASGPRCSTKVYASARIWQGWYSLVSPLITGTRECAAKRSRIDCSKVRIITRSTMRVTTLAAAQLGLAHVEHDGGAAELVDAGLEGHARARRALLEDHRQHPVAQRLVGHVVLEAVLQRARAPEEVLDFRLVQVAEAQEVLH